MTFPAAHNTLSAVPDDVLISAWRHAFARQSGGISEHTADWLFVHFEALGDYCRQILYNDLKGQIERHFHHLELHPADNPWADVSGPLGSGVRQWLKLWKQKVEPWHEKMH